jgi:serine/threonine protein kinase
VSDPRFMPSDADLIAFDQGLLPEERIDAITAWLEANPEGEDRLRRLTETQADSAVVAMLGKSTLDNELGTLSKITSRVIDDMLIRPIPASATASNDAPEHIREYRLEGKLGHGGMGEVYRARHARLRREAAVKLLPARLAADPAFRGRFEREMAVIGQLDHPNLVRAYDAGVEGEHLFLVMEFLDGRDFEALLRQGAPLTVADACEVVRQAALGLEYAHKHGIVHRDVKPGNLFLTGAGTVKVIDLGLARATDQSLSEKSLTSVNTVMGTPEYMAPEQWGDPNVGPSADVYALGCVLYALLTGGPPFRRGEGDAWVAILEAHRHAPPPKLRKMRPDVPEKLAECVSRMLAKSPSGRPASAAAVAQALTPFTEGHDLTTLLVSGPNGPMADTAANTATRPSGRPIRKRWLAAATAGLLIAVIAGVIWYVQHQRRHDLTPLVQAPAPPIGSEPRETATAKCLQLSYYDEYVELANTKDMIDLNGVFTVEMWVRFDRGIQYFVGDENYPQNRPNDVDREVGWVLRVDEDRGPPMRLNFTAATNTRVWYRREGPPMEFNDRWRHLAVSKDKQTVHVFLDGKPQSSADTSALTFVNGRSNLFLGQVPHRRFKRPTSFWFKAFRVSSTRLYSEAFTPPAEFTKTKDTLLLLDFSAGKGTVLPDLSGNGHDGKITGGYWGVK